MTSTDALGHVTTSKYDGDGRVTETIYPDGTDAQTVYDTNGRKVAAIDPDGNETDYRYDARGRLIAVLLPAVTDPATGKKDRPRRFSGFGYRGGRRRSGVCRIGFCAGHAQWPRVRSLMGVTDEYVTTDPILISRCRILVGTLDRR